MLPCRHRSQPLELTGEGAFSRASGGLFSSQAGRRRDRESQASFFGFPTSGHPIHAHPIHPCGQTARHSRLALGRQVRSPSSRIPRRRHHCRRGVESRTACLKLRQRGQGLEGFLQANENSQTRLCPLIRPLPRLGFPPASATANTTLSLPFTNNACLSYLAAAECCWRHQGTAWSPRESRGPAFHPLRTGA